MKKVFLVALTVCSIMLGSCTSNELENLNTENKQNGKLFVDPKDDGSIDTDEIYE